ARKNAFDAKDIMDWYNKSRLVNVEARSRAAWGKVKNFFINTLPPAPIADKYIKFRGLRNIGEVEIIREIPAIRARMIREHFKDGKPFKKLSKSDKDGLMATLEKYEYDIRDGNTEELNLDNLVKKYNLNPKQKEILELYQNTTRAFVDKARQFWGQYLFENEKNIAGYLGKRDFAKLFPEAVERTGRVITPNIAVANEIMSKNPALKIQAIDIITKKMYDYGDRFYLDSVRPTAPNYTIFRMEKITDNKNHEQQADGTYKDYVEGYGRNQKELNEQIDKWKS